MLKASLTAGGAMLLGFRNLPLPGFYGGARRDAQDRQYLGLIEFVGEAVTPMETPMGAGLDGRLYTDLSALTVDHPITPTEKFYVRTRVSEFLDYRKAWAIQVKGPRKQPMEISMAALRKTFE